MVSIHKTTSTEGSQPIPLAFKHILQLHPTSTALQFIGRFSGNKAVAKWEGTVALNQNT